MKNKLIAKACTNLQKVTYKAKVHSPEILIVTGVIGIVGSAIWACVNTTKVGDVLDEAKEKIDDIHAEAEEAAEKEETESAQPDEKKLVKVYAETGLAFVKLYGPPVVMGAFSLACILASNNILRQRNAALGAAYATTLAGFNEYRERVTKRFGEDVDKELRYGTKDDKMETVETDPETGKTKKVKKDITRLENDDDGDPFVRYFGKYTKDMQGNVVENPQWEENADYRMMHLRATERYANDLLVARTYVSLNDVYDMLSIPRTQAGQMIGWVYSKDNEKGDNFISFGLTDEIVYDEDGNPGTMLEFNADGVVWDKLKLKK